MRTRFMRHALLFLLLGHAVVARAAAVVVDAKVSKETIGLDETVNVTISIQRDGSQAFEGYRAPATPDFDVMHTSSSEQMQWVMQNGKQSVRMLEQHEYVLKPRKKGTLTIGSAAVRVQGQEFQSREVKIHVDAAAKQPPQAAGAASQNPFAMQSPQQQAALLQQQMLSQQLNMMDPDPSDLRGNEDVFIDARVDKPKVYVGEQVTASWRIFLQSELLRYRNATEPKHEDFWAENLFTPSGHLSWDRQTVRGRQYAVALLMKKALFPLKSGKLSISPLESEVTTMTTAFFNNASDVKKSKALTVEVLPLPAQGRPAGFESTNVGDFKIAGTADRDKVKLGEAVTWKLELSGVGNVHNVKLPKIETLDGFKVYEPTVAETVEPSEQVSGKKVYTYLLVPQRGGALTIPRVQFSFFDPKAQKYRTASTDPLPITAIGESGQVSANGAAAAGPQPENLLGAQIRPIRQQSGVHARVGERLFRSRMAAAFVLAGPPGLWLGVLVFEAIRRRLAKETARGRRRRARRSARRRMRTAEYQIRAMKPSAFFAECARVIYEHLEFRLGSKVEAMTLGELRLYLVDRGFPKETSDAVVQELENCDFARFAPSASGPGEMRAALRRVRTLLDWIEKVRITSDNKEAA